MRQLKAVPLRVRARREKRLHAFKPVGMLGIAISITGTAAGAAAKMYRKESPAMNNITAAMKKTMHAVPKSGSRKPVPPSAAPCPAPARACAAGCSLPPARRAADFKEPREEEDHNELREFRRLQVQRAKRNQRCVACDLSRKKTAISSTSVTETP